MGWACGAYGWGEGVYGDLVGKPEGRRLLGRPKRRWVGNIRLDLQKVRCGYKDWIGLAQDRDRWWTLVSAVMSLRVLWNAGNFLTSCKPVSFSRRTLHHEVSKEVTVATKLQCLFPLQILPSSENSGLKTSYISHGSWRGGKYTGDLIWSTFAHFKGYVGNYSFFFLDNCDVIVYLLYEAWCLISGDVIAKDICDCDGHLTASVTSVSCRR